jgi:hypothetical protein
MKKKEKGGNLASLAVGISTSNLSIPYLFRSLDMY